MGMTWEQRVFGALTTLPTILSDVERTHQGTGEEKQAAAIAIVKDALGTVDAAVPEHATKINAVANGVSNIIPSVVNILNLAGVFHHKKRKATA